MLRIIRSVTAAALTFFIGATLPATADDAVKQAQKFLTSLGYNVGAANGAMGKRTEKAIADVMAKYGLTYDSEVSANDVAFLAAIAPVKLKIDFDVAVSELYLVDSSDINGDARPDFVLTAMADPSAQLGIPCCEVPANRIKDLVMPVPILVYSTPTGYATEAFPPEAAGGRSQSGKFFTTPTGSYFVLAKNGEMGLPQENRGEFSQVYKVVASAAGIDLSLVAKYDGAGITASVDVIDLDGNSWPEIFLNNYGSIGPVTGRGTSTIKEFGANEKLTITKWRVPMEMDKAHNYVTLTDIDNDGTIDFLAAAEVMKSNDGKTAMTRTPGSYVIFDAFNPNTQYAAAINLDPPHFGKDHAGFSLVPIKVGGRIFLFEAAMKFFGHQAGGFQFDNLDVFELDLANKAFSQVTKDVLPKVSATRENAGGYYVRTADIDFDGVDEVYRVQYAKKPQYMDWNGRLFDLKDYPSKDYFKPNWLGTLAFLPDAERKCTRMVTLPQYLGNGNGTHKTEVHITTCLQLKN